MYVNDARLTGPYQSKEQHFRPYIVDNSGLKLFVEGPPSSEEWVGGDHGGGGGAGPEIGIGYS